jgi:predicted outer membrane repeat protein
MFELSHLIELSDISVYGNEVNVGCSSILSRYSTLHIQDSKFAGIQGSFGAAMMISRSCVTFFGNNTFSGNSASYGGSLYIFDSVVTLSGINTFVDNTSPDDIFDSQCLEGDEDDQLRGSGGAIYCSSSTLRINCEYSVFANNFANNFGGAIHAWDGNITVKGSVTFMENVVDEYDGGALFLFSVTLIVSGDISFINNKAYYGGALSIREAEFLIVGEERIANEKSFLNGATEFCRNVAMNGEIAHIEVLDNYNNSNFDVSGKGMAVFRGNMATSDGGGIKCEYNCHITIFDGSIFFEKNIAMYGGGMYLGESSKLILSSLIQNNISFISNHANRFGGALYVNDAQCSSRPKDLECFLSFYGVNFYATEKSLIFLNNSAGFKGSILYGGQLNKCGRILITDLRIDEYGNRAADYIYQYALVIFKNISRINSESASSITSKPEQMKFCQLEGEKIIVDNQTLDLYLYPGEVFNISVIALDQAGSPVPTTVFIENGYRKIEYYAAQLFKGSR